MKQPSTTQDHLTQALALLQKGLDSLLQTIENDSIKKELSPSVPLLKQIEEWAPNLPSERFRQTLFSLIETIDDSLTKAVEEEKIQPEDYGATHEQPTAPFLNEAIIIIGPEIEISLDKMTVSTVVPKEFLKIWTPERLREGLKRQGIVIETDEEPLQQLFKKPNVPQVIVKGQEPVSGKDAVLHDVIGLDQLTTKPSIDAHNRADFKDLPWIQDIHQDQIIFRKELATEGTPGLNVYGEEIPCQDGVDVEFPKIINTYVSEDELTLRSNVDGCLYKENNTPLIVPALQIKHNVDYSTGNLQSAVTITVDKDILSGFTVKSDQNILVKGTVEGAKLTAQGHLFLEGGVQGKDLAVLHALKSIHAKFINATKLVDTKEELIVDGPIIHSHIRCKRLFSQGQEAEILGGMIEAEDDVCAEQIGSEMGVKTEISLGHDFYEIEARIAKMDKQIQTIHDKIEEYKKPLTILQNRIKKGQSLSSSQKQAQQKIENQLEKMNQRIEEKKSQRQQLEEQHKHSNECVRMVRARKTICPGTIITILGHSTEIKVPTGPATVLLAGDEVEILPYQEREFEAEAEE